MPTDFAEKYLGPVRIFLGYVCKTQEIMAYFIKTLCNKNVSRFLIISHKIILLCMWL
jgi:hypothetical protein